MPGFSSRPMSAEMFSFDVNTRSSTPASSGRTSSLKFFLSLKSVSKESFDEIILSALSMVKTILSGLSIDSCSDSSRAFSLCSSDAISLRCGTSPAGSGSASCRTIKPFSGTCFSSHNLLRPTSRNSRTPFAFSVSRYFSTVALLLLVPLDILSSIQSSGT